VKITRSSARFYSAKTIVAALMIMGLGFSSWAQEKERPKDWNQILAAARKEGRVVVTSSPDATFRNEIMPKFMAGLGFRSNFWRAGRVRLRHGLRPNAQPESIPWMSFCSVRTAQPRFFTRRR